MTSANRAVLTLCVMLATIMQALDSTIANVALPYMRGSLGATEDQISWVLTSYIVASAIMTAPTGWLAGRFGRKRLFLVAVAGFTIASALCGMAGSLNEMVAFRLLQGVFGAPLVPLSQSVLLDIYPRERHGSAMAMWGVGVMVGPILGPTLGGWLTESWGWRWVFYVNLPIGILTYLGLVGFLRETERGRTAAFDWFGFLTLSLAIGAFQTLLDRGQQLDWLNSGEILLEGFVVLASAWMFGAHVATARRAFVNPQVFANRNFSTCCAFMFAVGIILLSTMALLTPYLQGLMNYPVLTAGLVMAPRGVGTMAAMLLVGRLIGRVDARLLVLFGLAVTATSLHLMSGYTPDVAQSSLIGTGILQGFGLGFIFVPLSTMAFSTLPPVMRTEATSLYSLIRNLGAGVGISMATVMLARNAAAMHASLAEHITPFLHGLPPAWNPATQPGLLAIEGEIGRQAAIIAYADDFRLMMWVAIAVMPLVLLLRPPAHAAADPHAAVID